MNIIGHRRIFLGISSFLVVASILAVAIFGFRLGIDFRGGTLWRFQADSATTESVQVILAEFTQSSDIQVSRDSSGAVLARLPELNEDAHQNLSGLLQAEYPEFEELSFQSIGPSVGESLRNKAVIALILVLVGISFYIAFAFRKVYQPVSSWKYGFITLITLMHDVIIPAGVIAVLGQFLNVDVDTNFLVALLVIMGFSVHDTIVVFDRIRENLLKERSRGKVEEVVNRSVNQTLARSINTSLTLILVLLALYLFGPETLNYFILTLLIGVSMGIYSSIFVASPLLIVWQGRSKKK